MSDAVIKMKRKCAAFIVMHHLIKKKKEKTVKKTDAIGLNICIKIEANWMVSN